MVRCRMHNVMARPTPVIARRTGAAFSVLALALVVSGSVSADPQVPAAAADITLACEFQDSHATFSLRIWASAHVMEWDAPDETIVYSAEVKETQISFVGTGNGWKFSGVIDRLTGQIVMGSTDPNGIPSPSIRGMCAPAQPKF